MKAPSASVDIAVIGGGLVGAAVAHGLLARSLSTALFDEGDTALRASRGNFGLVCAAGKGDQLTDYAPWALKGVEVWADFAEGLTEATGVDLELEQNGGFVFCPDEAALRARVEVMERLKRRSGLDFEVMRPKDIDRYMPGVSINIPGAIFCRIDGAANPLKLLRALHTAVSATDNTVRRDARVERIEPIPGGYRVVTAAGSVACEKVVLAAGLGNVALAEGLGVILPIKPMRGQILVTERCDPILTVPSEHVRQTRDGAFLLGGSWEDVGYDTSTTVEVTRDIATRAISYFPFLSKVRLVRSWSALRILAPDNAPIYDEITPGAFLVTCHSGVSLAAIHSGTVAGWIAGGAIPPDAAPFRLGRFAEALQPAGTHD